MEFEEEFISGFCKTSNMTRTVCCEYDSVNGQKTLTFMDCEFQRCENHLSCLIYRQAQTSENAPKETTDGGVF